MEITTARVVNSTQLELVLLSYELIIDDIDNNLLIASDSRKADLSTAKKFLRNLRNAVDRKYELSKNLICIYDFLAEILTQSEITNNADRREASLIEAKNIMMKLYEAWKKINDEEGSKEYSMTNTDVIYSGLTYGKGGLNETVLGNWNKGLKA